MEPDGPEAFMEISGAPNPPPQWPTRPQEIAGLIKGLRCLLTP